MIEKISEIWASQNLSLRTIEHLAMFSIAMILSILIGISIGILIYKRKRLANFVINLLNVIELIPTIALLIILLPFLGLGSYPTIAACVLYSLLPIARNTYTGLINVNKEYIEVSKGIEKLPDDPPEILSNLVPFQLPDFSIEFLRIAHHKE